MGRCNSKAIWMGLLATVWLCAGASAEQQPAEKTEATICITLGSISATTGDMVVVPVYFTPVPGVEVGRLKLEITYVSVNLKFAKLEAGTAAQEGGVKLNSVVKQAKNKDGVDTQTLQITTSFSDSGPPPKGIPQGLLAYLIMELSEAGRSARITLRSSMEATELGTDKPLEKLTVADATVDVIGSGAQQMMTCFFFTH